VRWNFELQLYGLVSFNNDTDGLKSDRQVAARYYVEKWSHCVTFVFSKLRDKTYLRFSFDSPSYKASTKTHKTITKTISPIANFQFLIYEPASLTARVGCKTNIKCTKIKRTNTQNTFTSTRPYLEVVHNIQNWQDLM